MLAQAPSPALELSLFSHSFSIYLVQISIVCILGASKNKYTTTAQKYVEFRLSLLFTHSKTYYRAIKNNNIPYINTKMYFLCKTFTYLNIDKDVCHFINFPCCRYFILVVFYIPDIKGKIPHKKILLR